MKAFCDKNKKANAAFSRRWPCFKDSKTYNRLKDITHAKGKFIRDNMRFHLFVF